MSLPAYPRYKPSGVEWLGQIPQHWESAPLKRFASLVTEKGDGSRRQLGLEHVASWTGEFIESSSDFSSNGTKFREDDILFGKLRPYLAKVGLANFEGEAVGDFHVIRSTDIEPHFLQLQMLTDWFINIVDGSTYGAKMPRASWDFVGGVSIAVPPRHEQVAIGCFLDRETAKIDALIEEQEKLIRLLQEKRQAVISHAVTKGLDPDAPMKPSGIDWLGDIPAHWEVKRLKHLSKVIQTGPFGSQLHSSDYISGGIPLINPANITEGGLRPNEENTVNEATADRLKEHRVQTGDILIGRRGEMGRCAIVATEQSGWLCGTGSMKLSLDADLINANFAVEVIKTPVMRSWLSLSSVGSTMDNLNATILGELPMTVPPLEEQAEILRTLCFTTEKLDQLIALAERGIPLERERRAALISAAVTGKIDVRDLAAQSVKHAEEVAA